MERINRTNLSALVPKQHESQEMTKSSPTSCAKDMAILSWVRLAAQQNKEEMPGEDMVRWWLQSLSSFPLNAINEAFGDYLAHEVDEWGKAWMPKPPQIVARCSAWVERNAGPPPDDLSKRMSEWREQEKVNAVDPEYLQAYSGLKEHLRKLWPGSKGGE